MSEIHVVRWTMYSTNTVILSFSWAKINEWGLEPFAFQGSTGTDISYTLDKPLSFAFPGSLS